MDVCNHVWSFNVIDNVMECMECGAFMELPQAAATLTEKSLKVVAYKQRIEELTQKNMELEIQVAMVKEILKG